MKLQIPALLICVSVLVGCSSPVKRQAETLAGSQACCKNLSDFTFQELKAGAPISVTIGDSSPAYQFAEGKSYAAAFRFAASGSSRRVLIKTDRTGLLPPDWQIFCPVATFSNEAHERISTTPDLPLQYEPPGWTTWPYWYVVIPVPPNARYMLVHTPAASIGKLYMAGSSRAAYTFSTGKSIHVVPGGSDQYPFPCGQTGRIEVETR
jgi:hypothetical protein